MVHIVHQRRHHSHASKSSLTCTTAIVMADETFAGRFWEALGSYGPIVLPSAFVFAVESKASLKVSNMSMVRSKAIELMNHHY